jgi:hypothetical protein
MDAVTIHPSDLAACRSCKAPIVFAVTEPGGSWNPLDPDPVEDGNVELAGRVPDDERNAGRIRCRTLSREEVAQIPLVPTPRYRSHFSTCPQASKWRKR